MTFSPSLRRPIIASHRSVPGVIPRRRDDLLQPLYVTARLGEMVLEGLAELVRARRARHLRERLDELLLRVLQVVDLVHENVLQSAQNHDVPLLSSDCPPLWPAR